MLGTNTTNVGEKILPKENLDFIEKRVNITNELII